MSDLKKRLEEYLTLRVQPASIEELTPDASTREYYRIQWDGGNAVACVYPESFKEADQSYLDVTKLFLSCGLPVAKVLDFDERLGVIIVEDFGSRILREELESAPVEEREKLIDRAITLIPRIQAATDTAFEIGSIASKLKFDVEKLMWELEFFKTHYFSTFLKKPLEDDLSLALTAEFSDLSRELETRATVLCHRDFHAANLMLDERGELRVIDHQDARLGSPTYDLVSLLLDRVTEPPTPEWLSQKRSFFLDERVKLGLPEIGEEMFADEFRLQTIQRCLKAVGTFSFQSVNRGKTYFVPFINPMFRIVLRAVENLQQFPVLQQVLQKQIEYEEDH
ncbi:MAG: aminoglycoside phosphotransferase family protein [Blastocatellia bacterium]